MTSKLFNYLLPELQVVEAPPTMAALPPKVTSLDLDIASPLGHYPGYHPLRPALSYQDVIRCSGMSWSKMLQETSKHEFREFSRESQRALSRSHQQLNTYCSTPSLADESHVPPAASHIVKSQSHLLPQHSLIIKPTQYHWVRTEDLDRKLGATDRPYRNTYGDKSSSPSKLFLSTELPTIHQQQMTEPQPDAEASVMYNKNRWVANRQIERIYSLLHSDPKHANKVHIITRRDSMGKGNSLPIILPHFYVQLRKSINQVMKEDQPKLDQSLSQTRRPMTSEKFCYKPLPQQPANPELIISKQGNIVIRDKKPALRRQHKSAETYNKMRLRPRNNSKSTTQNSSGVRDGGATPTAASIQASAGIESRVTAEQSVYNKRVAGRSAADNDNTQLLSARKRPILGKTTPRPAVTKSVNAGVENLQSADGFVFSVKITPKTPRGTSAETND